MFKWSADYLGGSLYFEAAAKLYKDVNNHIMAKDAYIKFAECSEKIDSVSCAADGYTQAAFLELDFDKSEQLLHKAQELYLIDGKGERGLMSLKKFVKGQLDEYEDKDLDDPRLMQRIMNLYKTLYGQVFQSEDNYIFNSDIVDEYMNLLMKFDQIAEAIKAR